MYHPPDVDGFDIRVDEYVEIFNPSISDANLFNNNGSWRINGGIDFDFPPEYHAARHGLPRPGLL